MVGGKPDKPSGRYPKGMKTLPNPWHSKAKPKRKGKLGRLMGHVMAGCSYCGQMHAPLYICDEMRKARALDKPMAKTVDTMAKDMAKTVTPMAKTTYRYRDPEKRRAYMRELMRRRYGASQHPSK